MPVSSGRGVGIENVGLDSNTNRHHTRCAAFHLALYKASELCRTPAASSHPRVSRWIGRRCAAGLIASRSSPANGKPLLSSYEGPEQADRSVW